MENIRDRVNLEFISQGQIQKIIYRQFKLSFKGIVDRYKNFSVYKYDKERIIFDKPIYLGFCILEFSKLLKFYYDKFRPYGQDEVQLHYMVTDSFVLSFNTDLKNRFFKTKEMNYKH